MSSAALASTMTPIQALGVFVGIPLLICAVVVLAVCLPVWRRRRRLSETFRSRQTVEPLTAGVLLEHPDGEARQ